MEGDQKESNAWWAPKESVGKEKLRKNPIGAGLNPDHKKKGDGGSAYKDATKFREVPIERGKRRRGKLTPKEIGKMMKRKKSGTVMSKFSVCYGP